MTSLGFGKKVDRIERDPHVALDFQAEVAAADGVELLQQDNASRPAVEGEDRFCFGRMVMG